MPASDEQLKSGLRSFIALFGGLLAGFAAGHGWMTKDQAWALLNNEQFLGNATTLIVFLIGVGSSIVAAAKAWLSRSKPNMIATVAAMPEVAEVKIMPTNAGMDIAHAVPPTPGAIVSVAQP